MAARPLVILHGWSDVSASFEPLARFLAEELGGGVSLISLADYLSMEDEVRFDDLVSAMDRAWDDHNLPRGKGKVDAIVHSTGGLVIRDWLNRTFSPGRAPIKHLVMLAPANFGSPLAHKGRSLAGRVFKGFVAKRPAGVAFETGTRILKGLELASPYSWDLAERDRFGKGGEMYGPGNVLCTVLVGNRGYKGISSIANEDGSDGTVRVSTANMECVRMRARFPANPDVVGHDVAYELEASSGLTAFGIEERLNHGTITLSGRGDDSLARLKRRGRDGALFADILQALKVSDDGFPAHARKLAKRNDTLLPSSARVGSEKHVFQNTVVRVQDQYGVGVPDYLLEFYEKDEDAGGFMAEFFHGSAIHSVHPYSDDSSYRSVYMNCTELMSRIDKLGEELSVSLTATPELDPPRTPVGFTTLGNDGIGGMRIPRDELPTVFAPHRTALVTLELTRQQSDAVFRFREAPV